jgi:NAD(P)-dependent dehydrogenase (short-subunit alcohol dehydrogenase family)
MPVALVTGASRGLGLALTESLANKGWRLVADGRDGQALENAVGDLPSVTAIPGDVADPDHRERLAEAVQAEGRLDLLLNNASTLGATPLPRLAELPIDTLAHILQVNTLAPLALVQSMLPLLRVSGGAVINVTSDAGVEAYEGWGGYGSSKAALDQLSAILAAEEQGIRVWAFDPGDMQTQMHQDAFPGEDITDRPLPETVVPAILRLLSDRPPSGRLRASDLLELAAAR